MANIVLLKSGGTQVGSPPVDRIRGTLRRLGVASGTGRGALLQPGEEQAAAAIGEP